MNKIINKFIIPDLSNIIIEYCNDYMYEYNIVMHELKVANINALYFLIDLMPFYNKQHTIKHYIELTRHKNFINYLLGGNRMINNLEIDIRDEIMNRQCKKIYEEFTNNLFIV